jgi:hypothetical protein
MNTKKLPLNEEYVYPIIAFPIDTYIKGFDLLSEQCSRTNDYRNDDPSTESFQEYMFWRKNLVIWTCCMIEAFVNLEGVSWMGEEFYRSTIERQRIIDKIRLVYTIKYCQLLDRSENILQEIQYLFDLRNQFVHPKSRQQKDSKQDNNRDLEFLANLNPAELKELAISVNGLIKDPEDRQN